MMVMFDLSLRKATSFSMQYIIILHQHVLCDLLSDVWGEPLQKLKTAVLRRGSYPSAVTPNIVGG